jgi:hypothetical protein
MPPKLTGMQHFKKHWYAVEVLPYVSLSLHLSLLFSRKGS